MRCAGTQSELANTAERHRVPRLYDTITDGLVWPTKDPTTIDGMGEADSGRSEERESMQHCLLFKASDEIRCERAGAPASERWMDAQCPVW